MKLNELRKEKTKKGKKDKEKVANTWIVIRFYSA